MAAEGILTVDGQKRKEEIIELIRSSLELFANDLAGSLLTLLATHIQVEMVSVEKEKYGEFINSIEPPTCFCTFLMENFRAPGAIELEVSPALSIVERLMGGAGKSVPPRPPTEIELMVVKRVMEILLDVFGKSLSGVIDSNLTLNELTADPRMQVSGGAFNGEVIKAVYKVTIGGSEGNLRICVPQNVIKIGLSRKRFNALSRANIPPGRYKDQILKLLFDSQLEIRASIPIGSITVRELLDLQEGDVINLNFSSEEEMEVIVKIEDTPKFLGKLGLVGRYRSVKLQEMDIEKEEESEGKAGDDT